MANRSILCGRLLAAGVAVVFLAGDFVLTPYIDAQQQAVSASLPSFEISSIRPNRSGDTRWYLQTQGRFTATNITPRTLIEFAYGVKDYQLAEAPKWIQSEHYDIEAVKPDSIAAQGPLDLAQTKLMVQSLLAERFDLRLTYGTKEVSGFALTVAGDGSKLVDQGVLSAYVTSVQMETDHLTLTGSTVGNLAEQLSLNLGRPVVDRTGLKGVYDLTLQWQPDQNPFSAFAETDQNRLATDTNPGVESLGSSIFGLLQEQLGLKLEPQKSSVVTLVINHIDRPSDT
jgi:uncharacterized protein (TIGR03435 family)